MHRTVGCAPGCALWNQCRAVARVARLGLAAAGVAVAAAVALVRPYGRGLEEWAFVALHYLAVPKLSVWRPRAPDQAAWRPPGGSWAEFAPRLSWRPARSEAEEAEEERR